MTAPARSLRAARPARTSLTAEEWRSTATEAETQAAIVEGLERLGYVVLKTDRHRRKCSTCRTYATTGDGTDYGVPDLLVYDPRRGSGETGPRLWGLEVKKPSGGRLSPAQRRLEEMGAYRIVRSLTEALEALR